MSESNENRRNESSREQRQQSEGESRTFHSSVETTEDEKARSETSTQKSPFSRNQWEKLPADPDLQTDLEYSTTDWEVIETLDNSNQVIFMPEDEELLKDDAFIVADERITCDLGKHY